MKKYIDPEVRLIDGTKYDLGFYTWLKSRRKVIKLEDGTQIDDVHIDGVTTDDLYFDSNYHIIFEIRKDNGESDMKLLVDKSSILSNDELKLIHPGLIVRGLDICDQSPLEPGTKTLIQGFHLLGGLI